MVDELKDLRQIKLPFDVDSVSPKCHECIRKQLKKYEKKTDAYGKTVGSRFVVPCTGIPKDYIDPSLRATCSDEEYEEMLAAVDIVSWAKKYIKHVNGEPWVARWYQEFILRCSSRRKTLRISRRAGKCIAGQSKVLSVDGPVTAKELFTLGIKPSLVSFNQIDGKLITTSDYSIWQNGEKDTYTITTQYGKETTVTDNHPFLTMNKDGEMIWKETKELSIGEHIFVPADYSNVQFNESSLAPKTARLLGYLTGDSTLSYTYASIFTNINKAVISDLECLLEDFNCELTPLDEQSYIIVSKNKDRHTKHRNLINSLLDYHDMRHKAIDKKVPKEVLSGSKEVIVNFLAGYWDTDGWVSVNKQTYKPNSTKVEIGISSASKQLAKDIQFLLLRLGIFANLSYKQVRYKDSFQDNWTVIIVDKNNIANFHSQIKLIGKQDALDAVFRISEQKEDTLAHYRFVPNGITSYIKKCKKQQIPNWQAYKRNNNLSVSSNAGCDKTITKDKLNKFAQILDDDYLKWLSLDDFAWEKIVSIEYAGKQETYDLNIPETSTMVVDNIISHNTDLVCIEICYYLFTEPNTKLLIAGPQKSHTEEIINRVRAFINSNSALSEMVIRDVSAPYYEIKLSNGSRLRGFAAGTKGKGDGTGIRGQDADRIYCFPKGTRVNTSEFAIKPIEKLTLQDTVLGGNSTGVFVGDIQQLGVRKNTLITIPTPLNIIKCTPDHPLFDGQNDIAAKDASEVILSLYYNKLTFGYETIIARLLGFLYGDGWISNNSVGWSGQPKDLEQVQSDLMLLGDKKHFISARETENINLGIKGFGAQLSSAYAYSIFKDLHPFGRKVFQPLRVPKMIMEGRPYIKTSFLSGLFSAESTGVKYQQNKRTPRTLELNMCSQKQEWIQDWFSDICVLLDELEIKYSFHIEQAKERDRYIGFLSISNSKENIDLFIDKIGFCYNAEKTKSSNIWKLYRYYERVWGQDNWKKNRLIRNQIGSSSKIANKLKIPLSTVKYHKNLMHPIYSYDLITPEELINKLTWKENYVKLPILKEAIKYSTELVDVYNLTSGAANRFFAEGIFTHNCEEMDYIDDNAINSAIFPILQTNASTALIGFSTPSGFPTPYFKLCTDNPYYNEFHYDYKVLPHWKNIEMERSSFTQDQWAREFLAEFSQSEDGVYKPIYIEKALQSYVYTEIKRLPTWRYCIGTDWNEKHGAEIVVLGFNTLTGIFQVVEVAHVQHAEFTQLASVEKLLELNKKWKPSFVYADIGNGSTNIELLRKIAYEERTKRGDLDTAKLLDILKKYDSGSSLLIKDPITGEERKAPAKAFMVNASIRMFEQCKIFISAEDTVLKNQLENYIIERYTPTGNPVYNIKEQRIGDHRLDALNLAIVAFELEFSDLHKVNNVTAVAMAVDPRMINIQDKKGLLVDEKNVSMPESRRIPDGGMSIVTPSYIGAEKNTTRTNRKGWETDTEQLELLKYLQRKRSRDKFLIDRPNRTTF